MSQSTSDHVSILIVHVMCLVTEEYLLYSVTAQMYSLLSSCEQKSSNILGTFLPNHEYWPPDHELMIFTMYPF